MSSTDRQNRLLLAEDWKRVYQSFSNADFQSYDFDNLRRTMINYLRENYPEDFNDYIESSEYLALVDLIAFLGQNISFRIDLNARENYLELAERRESVLRLARLLSYNPKRVQPANGLLKIDSIRTSEEVIDSNGLNLQNQTVVWNDPTNTDWFEQFVKVLNTALPVNSTFGRPVKKEVISNVPTEQYRTNSINTDVPVYSFDKSIEGRSLRFEVVSTDISDNSIEEEAPFPGNKFAFLYRDDGRGAGSSNTGFFCHFRQGIIDQGTFTISNPSSNQTVAIEAPNINNSDVWLYKLDSVGNEEELWTKVDAVEGNNVIYNSLNKKIRNIYSVLTRVDDRISLIFSDGVFGNLPRGQFRAYYRTSQNQRVIVTPESMRGVSISIPYTSKAGRTETLTLSLSLKYTVDNSAVSESNNSIKRNAPSTYYTQNRMITGEDYQVAPLGISQDIIKAKAVNRVASGISRYFDLVDATGKYSQTTLFGNDGVVYKEYLEPRTSFSFLTRTDVEGAIINTVEPILSNSNIKNYYYDKFPKILVGDLGVKWNQVPPVETNFCAGYFTNKEQLRAKLGSYTGNILKLLTPGTLIKFVPPSGKHFMPDGTLMTGEPSMLGASTYKWCKIVSVEAAGTVLLEDGTGPVVLNDIIPSDSIISEIRPSLARYLEDDVKTQIIDQIFAYKTFGIRFDTNLAEWRLVTENNLNVSDAFTTGKTGDTSNQQLDASWLLLFQTNGERYTVTYRGMRYVFESDQEIRFFYDSSDKIYDNKTGKIVKDKISVLNINTKPDDVVPFTLDYDWEIVKEYRDAEGYVDSKKVEVSFYDSDADGVPDDVDIFAQIVAESANQTDKIVIFKKYTTSDGVEDFNFYNNDLNIVRVFTSKGQVGPLSQYKDGTVFYYINEDIFEVYDKAASKVTLTTNYKARLGRDLLKFKYIHAADSNSRIDPSASNIIDMYLLTKNYDTDFRNYLIEEIATKPLAPSTDELFVRYGTELNKIKSLSDEVIYHPVKYKILFGSKAEEDLQAKFKIVKNPDLVINDNEIKSAVINAINEYFALENWEFGETFYFSELAGYVMNKVAPNLVTFVIVPVQETQSFGSMFEIKSEADEIFISGATVNDIEVIDAITATRLKATGTVLTASDMANAGLQSGSFLTNTSSTTGGGYSY